MLSSYSSIWYTMLHADGSIVQTFDYLKQNGLQGFVDIWPRPTAIAWKIIACYAAFEALLQLALPGKRVEGPISPAGNVPANGMLAYAVTLVTYIGLWWFGIFNTAIVYDHFGGRFTQHSSSEVYSFGHVAPSSTDSGSSGNLFRTISLYFSYSGLSFTESDHLGMELYPRIGKYFDIKVFTNCRFGMMSWGVLAVTYCIKQLGFIFAGDAWSGFRQIIPHLEQMDKAEVLHLIESPDALKKKVSEAMAVLERAGSGSDAADQLGSLSLN
ncbi:hypothetical protein MKW92_012671 [Papaver armeniacum]|nr:hypothetical protein MKW92_012671 [Papaver armeniacum]